MKTRTFLAAFLLVVLTAAVGGQTSSTDKKPAPPTGPTLDQLVEQLGDPDFRKRDIAANLLREEGVKALPVLRASLKHPDAEVRRRLLDLIPSIETAAILAPKRITLKVKNKNLNEIFAELTKQTSYRYEYYHNDPNAKFTVDLNNVTFWEAMDKLGKQTNLVLQQGYGDDRMRFNWQEGGGAPYNCTDGSFRFTATGFQLYKHVDLMQSNPNANRRSESLTFTFAVQSEPKLPLLGLGQPRLSAAFDTEKNSMLIPSNPNDGIAWEGRQGYISRYGNGNKMYYQQTQVNLNRVSEKATGVKVLRGVVPVTLLSEQKPHVIAENLLQAKGKKATVGTTTLTVEDALAVKNANPPQYQVRITFNEDTGGNPNDYSWQNSIYQRIEAQDSKGTKLQLYGTNWGNSNGTSVQMTLTYASPDPNKKPVLPIKIVFYEWKVMQHQLKFEFKDLPLP